LCMAQYLFDVEDKNRLAQIGLLKRFSLDCYGKQLTLEDIRSEKAEKYKELAGKRESREYEMWFLKYVPSTLDKNKSNEPGEFLKKPKKLSKHKTKKISIFDILRRTQRKRGI